MWYIFLNSFIDAIIAINASDTYLWWHSRCRRSLPTLPWRSKLGKVKYNKNVIGLKQTRQQWWMAGSHQYTHTYTVACGECYKIYICLPLLDAELHKSRHKTFKEPKHPRKAAPSMRIFRKAFAKRENGQIWQVYGKVGGGWNVLKCCCCFCVSDIVAVFVQIVVATKKCCWCLCCCAYHNKCCCCVCFCCCWCYCVQLSATNHAVKNWQQIKGRSRPHKRHRRATRCVCGCMWVCVCCAFDSPKYMRPFHVLMRGCCKQASTYVATTCSATSPHNRHQHKHSQLVDELKGYKSNGKGWAHTHPHIYTNFRQSMRVCNYWRQVRQQVAYFKM